MSYDASNIFARILRGEIPAAKIDEDADSFAFMDAFPQSKGHCLIIPKSPARDLLDCPPDVAAQLMKSTQRIAKAVDAALKPDGLRVMQFNRAPSGQSVFHIHFHIIPVYEGVPLRGHAQGEMAKLDELQALAQKIRAAL